jgi:hypothetical protein
MRASLILFSALVLLAACSNDTETTAPRSIASTASTGGYNTKLDFPPGPGATAFSPVTGTAAKSKVITVFSPMAEIDGVIIKDAALAEATCPAGTTLIGGGYRVFTGPTARVVESMPSFNYDNTWQITVVAIGAYATFQALARCQQ